MSFQLCNLTVERGQKVSGFLQLPFSGEGLPTTIIYGVEEGDTILVTGGIHNAEYVGIECVTGLSRELEPKDIKGILIMINIVNVNGFRARTVSVSMEDGKNLNRVFPGSMDGTYTDKLAYFIEKELFSKINYYIDVHNGDWFEDLSPFIYCVGNAKPEVVAQAEKMAQAADVPFYIKSSSTTGSYSYAGCLGIPSVLLERGCGGVWSEEEAKDSRKDVKNILRSLGLLIRPATPEEEQKQIPRHMHHAHYIDSEQEGCWFPTKHAGDIVRAGELIGVMKDYFGNIIKEFRLNEDCQILYQTISYSIPKDSPLIAYGHYNECIDNLTSEHAEHIHAHEELHDKPAKNLESTGIHSFELWEDML